jgi:hypothetical protein
MEYLMFLLATMASLAIIRIHERLFKQVLNKRYVLVVALLLGYAIAWGGSKGGGEEPPPEPPTPPEEPDEPVVENVRLRLIGRVNEQGQFVPLTSEWIEVTTTNGVVDIEQIEEIINE